MSGRDPEERLNELEIKLSFQDDLLEKLNACIVELRGQIDHLKAKVERHEQQLRSGTPEDAANERPPHY